MSSPETDEAVREAEVYAAGYRRGFTSALFALDLFIDLRHQAGVPATVEMIDQWIEGNLKQMEEWDGMEDRRGNRGQ